MKVKDK